MRRSGHTFIKVGPFDPGERQDGARECEKTFHQKFLENRNALMYHAFSRRYASTFSTVERLKIHQPEPPNGRMPRSSLATLYGEKPNEIYQEIFEELDF